MGAMIKNTISGLSSSPKLSLLSQLYRLLTFRFTRHPMWTLTSPNVKVSESQHLALFILLFLKLCTATWHWVGVLRKCQPACLCLLSFSVRSYSVMPWTVAHQAPLSMGFPRQEYWSGLPFPPSGDLPDPGIKPAFLGSPALAGGFFTTAPLGRPRYTQKMFVSLNFLKMSLVSVTTLALYASLWGTKCQPLQKQTFILHLSHPLPQPLGSCLPVSLLHSCNC